MFWCFRGLTVSMVMPVWFRVHEEYPHLLGEMFAYSIAAAHHRLPHLVLDK